MVPVEESNFESPSKKTSTTKPIHPETKIDMTNPGCTAKVKKLAKYNVINGSEKYSHPSIVHYAKFSKSPRNANVTLNFREYVSVLSIFKFLKPERLIFHTYTRFSGPYWDKINHYETKVKVEENIIPPVTEINGKKPGFIQHEADFVKLSALHKYGGTALDFDVIMLNGTRWRYLQRRSECVLVEQTGMINGGLYSCIKGAPFIAKWLEGYTKDYRPSMWLFNASDKPMYILTRGRTCYNVHVDESVCHNPSYGDRKRWLQVKGADWKDKMAVHYYIKKDIPNDGEALLNANFSLADMMQYVYRY